MFDWNSLGGGRTYSPPSSGSSGLNLFDAFERRKYTPPTVIQEEEEEEVVETSYTEERNWFDRVLAPITAPQQTLYSLTQDVAEDGFQWKDVWNAMSHGANYFNPWSDAQRITEDAISDIFFGEEREGAGRVLGNLAIGILYDPLLVGGVASKLGATGRTLKGIQYATNPASAAFDGLALAGRGTQAMVKKFGREALGDTRWNDMTYQIASKLVAPSKLLGPEWHEKTEKIAIGVLESRLRTAPIIETVKNAGRQASDLLTEALETIEIRRGIEYSRQGKAMLQGDAQAYQAFVNKVEAAGVDKDMFFDATQRFLKENDYLAGGILKHNLVPEAVANEMAYQHLRRKYTLDQSPTDMQRRIDHIAQKYIDPVTGDDPHSLLKPYKLFQEAELRDQLYSLADELGNVKVSGLARRFQADNILPSSVQRRYFPNVQGHTGQRRFNADNFMDDFREYVRSNPTHSIDAAMDHVKNNMMGGIELPAGFGAAIANYLSKGMVETQTLTGWAEKIATARATGQVSFRNWAQNLDVVKNREQIPDIIAKELLGEVETALPRLVEQFDQTTRQVKLAEFFDDVSGAVRISSDNLRTLQDRFNASARTFLDNSNISGKASASTIRNAINKSPDVRQTMDDMATSLKQMYPSLPDADAQRIVRNISNNRLNANEVIYKQGGLATPTPTSTNTVRVTGDGYGSLGNMYVPPTVAAMLRQKDRAMSLAEATDPKHAFSAMGDWISGMTSKFKFVKIAMDAGAHFRDTVGGLVQMDMMGMMPFHVNTWRKAAQVVGKSQNGEIDDYLALAHSVGYNLYGTTLSGAELGRAAARATDTLTSQSIDWIDEGASIFKKTMDAVGSTFNKTGELYQTRENLIRSYAFIHKYDELLEGMTKAGTVVDDVAKQNLARQAAEFTNRALFNYADVPLAVEFARKYGLAPFLTFPAKSAGQLMDVLYTNPASILKYDRTLDAWNSGWAGGDEQFAKEVQALPQHMRESLVVRLPWENRDGNPLYVDLSYFLPWSAVRDLANDANSIFDPFRGLDVSGPPEDRVIRGSYPGASATGGIFSPVIGQLIKAVAQGKDGLGRPLYSETATTAEKLKGLSQFLMEFWTPPTWPGGATADGVGRALTAAARTSDEPVDWVEWLGLGSRMQPLNPASWFGTDEDIVNRYGEGPQTRALPTLTQNPAGQAALGMASLFIPSAISNPEVQARNERSSLASLQATVENQVRVVMRNPNLSSEEKNRRRDRLIELFQHRASEVGDYTRFLFD